MRVPLYTCSNIAGESGGRNEELMVVYTVTNAAAVAFIAFGIPVVLLEISVMLLVLTLKIVCAIAIWLFSKSSTT